MPVRILPWNRCRDVAFNTIDRANNTPRLGLQMLLHNEYMQGEQKTTKFNSWENTKRNECSFGCKRGSSWSVRISGPKQLELSESGHNTYSGAETPEEYLWGLYLARQFSNLRSHQLIHGYPKSCFTSTNGWFPSERSIDIPRSLQ